ncbi:lipid-binding SYLF domain-containing protein [Oleidesulfovibrio sp.]|uniref:lipid-binding SYLF domain-containing protein n=1 Tax=Oleidesulfovibrio sp. TaxID=2909707 RepID=UPI003A8B79BF
MTLSRIKTPRRMYFRPTTALLFILSTVLLLSGCITSKGTLPLKADGTYEQEMIDDGVQTLAMFMGPDSPKPVRMYLEQAKGVLLVPSLINGGFIFGVRGGTGLLFARGPAGDWSAPVFMNISGASFGFQAGAQQAAVLMAFMTDEALKAALYDNGSASVQASVAAGPTGTGDEYSTLTRFQRDDIFYAAMNQGFYFGGTVQVASMSPRKPMNAVYYGPDATVQGILFDRTFDNSGTHTLRMHLDNASYGLDVQDY